MSLTVEREIQNVTLSIDERRAATEQRAREMARDTLRDLDTRVEEFLLRVSSMPYQERIQTLDALLEEMHAVTGKIIKAREGVFSERRKLLDMVVALSEMGRQEVAHMLAEQEGITEEEIYQYKNHKNMVATEKKTTNTTTTGEVKKFQVRVGNRTQNLRVNRTEFSRMIEVLKEDDNLWSELKSSLQRMNVNDSISRTYSGETAWITRIQ